MIKVSPHILEKLKSSSMRSKAQDRALEPLAEPVAKEALIAELSRCELMVETSEGQADRGMAVYRGFGADIPLLLQEIGLRREETFRTVGEGSGLARDLDRYDLHYDHYIAWDKAKGEITGAYRIGRIDEILKRFGPEGVYTNTLFHLESLLAADFKEGTLEAGRSFVRPEYQRGATLLLIWTALGRFISSHPQYVYLMGPVSISNEFQESSKHLMVSYLMKHFTHEKSDMVQGKNPPVFDSNLTPEELTALVDSALDMRSLQEFIRHAENNPKAQIPQLIKLYLELGVRFLAFHKDEDFNSVDGLIWLDITKIPLNIVVRYMGQEGWATYSGHHGL